MYSFGITHDKCIILMINTACMCADGVIFILRKEMQKMPVIDTAATGANIKAIMRSKGFRVADIQEKCGFNTPQAIFKWLRGDTVPTIDNMIIIADMFGVTIDQIIIIKRI